MFRIVQFDPLAVIVMLFRSPKSMSLFSQVSPESILIDWPRASMTS